MPVKYSIIVPSYNGGEYIKHCINSITQQDYDDYELIISDDHSIDGTKEYLHSISSNPRIKFIEPTERLSMTEHWEWALSHAEGEWLIFVGQDDALQSYFFVLADKLITIAAAEGIRAVASERAYFFWGGCESTYGDVAVSYSASPTTKILTSSVEATKALVGINDYFDLPQMYTTSLFHRSLLNEAKNKQGGLVFSCHPQDANLAALACSLEKKYLKSCIPLGWVGSSPKSAGLAVSAANNKTPTAISEDLKTLKSDYEEKIKKSKFKYNSLAGDFALADLPVYFWQAFLETHKLRSDRINGLLRSSIFKYVFFSLLTLRFFADGVISQKKHMLLNVFRTNNLNLFISAIFLIACAAFSLLYKLIYFSFRVVRKISRIVSKFDRVTFFVRRSERPDILPEDASKEAHRLVEKHFGGRIL